MLRSELVVWPQAVSCISTIGILSKMTVVCIKGIELKTITASGSVQTVECLLQEPVPRFRSVANDATELPVRMVIQYFRGCHPSIVVYGQISNAGGCVRLQFAESADLSLS